MTGTPSTSPSSLNPAVRPVMSIPHSKTMSAANASAVIIMIHFVLSRMVRIMARRLLECPGPARMA